MFPSLKIFKKTCKTKMSSFHLLHNHDLKSINLLYIYMFLIEVIFISEIHLYQNTCVISDPPSNPVKMTSSWGQILKEKNLQILFS